MLRYWDPAADGASSICPSRRFFHLPCPACGLTRAVLHLARGEWGAALVLHPLAPLLVLEVAGGWLFWGLALAGWRPRLPARTLETVLWGHVAAFLALWVVRAATGTLPW